MEAPAASRANPENPQQEIQARQRLMLCMQDLIRDLGQANADLARELDRRQRMSRKLARLIPEPDSPDEPATLLLASGGWGLMNVADVPENGGPPTGGISVFAHLGKALRDPARLFVNCLRTVPRWELLAERVGRASPGERGQLTGLALDLVCLRLAEPVIPEVRRRIPNLQLTETAAIMVTDADGLMRLANRRLTLLAGQAGQELLGRPWFRVLLPEEDWPMARTLPGFPALSASGERDLWIKGTPGMVFPAKWFSAAILRNRNPVGAVTVIMADGSEPFEHLEALAHRERFFRRVLDEQGTGRFICAPDGRLRECNEAFAHIFGFPSATEAIGCNLRPLHLDDAAAAQFGDALRRNGRLVSADTTMRRVDGRPIQVICHASAAANGRGEVREITGLIFDVTAQRQREDQRWQTQRIETVGRLAGGVAHDFNNLLAVIQGYADLLEGQVGENGPAVESARQIQQAAERAATLTRQLLAFGRRQVLQPTGLQLNEMVEAMLPQLRNLVGDQMELVTDLAPALGIVWADRAQFEQVLVHLATNAREALPHGGRLTFTTRNLEVRHSPGTSDPLLAAGEYVELCVGDNGPGMTDEAKANLFEPFFTTKELGKSAGLGLPMVYGIVKQSGGDIQVRSVTGGGTRVHVVLPRVQPKSATTHPIRKPTPRSGVTILLVDDETPVRQLVKQVLAREGYRVIDARSGAEALAVIEQTGLIPDLLVTDIVMPGLSGGELWERLRVRQPDLPVIYISSTEDVVIKNGVLSQQITFLQKPFRPEALVEKVAAALISR